MLGTEEGGLIMTSSTSAGLVVLSFSCSYNNSALRLTVACSSECMDEPERYLYLPHTLLLLITSAKE